MSKVLFFETYSVLQTLLLFRHVRQAGLIYFHKGGFPRPDFNPRAKKTLERLIRFFNSKAEIKTISADKVYRYNWDLNKEAVGFIEELVPEIQGSSAYKMILNIIGDADILKFYQQRLAVDLPDRLLFLKISRDLVAEHDSITIIPKRNDTASPETRLFGGEALRKYYPPGIFGINSIRAFFEKAAALATLMLFPLGFVILRSKITLRKINRGSYDVAMPVMWGFQEGEGEIGGVRSPYDDSYLYNNEAQRGRIIHVFGDWRRAPEVEENYKGTMAKKGIPYTDKGDYRANKKFLLTTSIIQMKIIAGLLKSLFYRGSPADYVSCNIWVINAMLRKYLEFENIDYKVEMMRHDYNASHIVEAIICKQHGIKTVGIQHGATAGPYVMNSLCYAHMDKYCIFSDAHLRLYSPYWEKLNLARTGTMTVDWTINLSQDRERLSELREKMRSLYPARKYTALIAFPGPAEYNSHSRWDEMFNALWEFESLNTDCNVFLRFKTTKDFNAPHIKRFAGLPERDPRLIIDLTNFTTYELMALCDLYITSSHSSGLIEATAIGKKAFTFDYMGTTRYCFGNYGKDLVLKEKDDVLALFKNLENGFTGYDCNWELLKKEYNYHYDGRCAARLQSAVWETVDEVARGEMVK